MLARVRRVRPARGHQKLAAAGTPLRINLCCGPVKLPGYVNVDIHPSADVVLDLEKVLLPFPDNSAEVVVCISAINYFTRERALDIISDVHRVLQPDGVARFGVQDLRVLARRYLERDHAFYFQLRADGSVRFPGDTFADKLGQFYCRPEFGQYVYDYETLGLLFARAGFVDIEERGYRESALEGIDAIDNRPEQMFFLEARKGSSAYFSGRGTSLYDTGQREQGWQHVLHALLLDPCNSDAVRHALEVLLACEQRIENAHVLVEPRVGAPPDDMALAAVRDRLRRRVSSEAQAPCEHQPKALAVVDELHGRRNAILADEVHLGECMRWLRHAQTRSLDDGLPAQFDLRRRQWGLSYPETTGYAIPTFLCYSRHAGDPEFGVLARRMGDWEIRIQAVSGGGGEPLGRYDHPRVFNTGQIILGWVALFRATEDQRYLAASQRAAHFLLQRQDARGRWSDHEYLNRPSTYSARVSWALLELYAVTRYPPYRTAAEANVHWVLSESHPNGWFDKAGLSRDRRLAGTHPIAYVLGGLLEIVRLRNAALDYDLILRRLCAAANNLVRVYEQYGGGRTRRPFLGLPDQLDARWRSSDRYSCLTGNIQLEYFLRRLAPYARDQRYAALADQLLADTKQLHLLDGITDDDLRGGLCGSDPVGGGYCRHSIPNWGVKFFADSLLQRTGMANDLVCVG